MGQLIWEDYHCDWMFDEDGKELPIFLDEESHEIDWMWWRFDKLMDRINVWLSYVLDNLGKCV